MKNTLIIRSSLLAAAFILFSLPACSWESGGDETTSLIVEGDKVPSFEVSDNEGNVFRSPEDFYGKVTILLFFDTGCGDCQRELPIIEDAWKILKTDSRINAVAISRFYNPEDIVKYWNANNMTLPKYYNNGRAAYDKFATRTIPRLYIVNAEGIVRYMGIEHLELTPEELTSIVRSYL